MTTIWRQKVDDAYLEQELAMGKDCALGKMTINKLKVLSKQPAIYESDIIKGAKK